MRLLAQIGFILLLVFLGGGIYDLVRIGVESMFDVRPGGGGRASRSDACQPQVPSPLRLAGSFRKRSGLSNEPRQPGTPIV